MIELTAAQVDLINYFSHLEASTLEEDLRFVFTRAALSEQVMEEAGAYQALSQINWIWKIVRDLVEESKTIHPNNNN